jgi:hypothetical protein
LELTFLVGSPLGPYLIVEIEKLKEWNVYSCPKISCRYIFSWQWVMFKKFLGFPFGFFYNTFFHISFGASLLNSPFLNSLVSLDLSLFQVLKQIIGLGSFHGPKGHLACHQAFSSHFIRKYRCHLFYCHDPNYILGELGISCFILDFLMSSYHNFFLCFVFD